MEQWGHLLHNRTCPMTARTENLNVVGFDHMPSPTEIKARVPMTQRAAETVLAGRRALMDILDRKDPRLFVVVGPCSIHDPVAGLDYARRLKRLRTRCDDTMLLVMRVYFEKPRTTTGWKGYINDPHMDDSFHIEEGMERGAPVPAATWRSWACPRPPRRSTRSRRSTWAT